MVAGPLGSVSVAENLVDEGLVAHWKFDEGTGSQIIDSSGNGYNGILEGDATWEPGIFGSALALDGYGDRAVVFSSSLKQVHASGEISYAIWFLNQGSGSGVLFHRGDASGCRYEPVVHTSTVRLSGCGGTGRIGVGYGASLGPGWQHTAVTFSESSDRAIVYLNGEEITRDSGFIMSALSSENVLSIGAGIRSAVGSGTANHFQGLLEDFRIYDRELTPEEVAELANLAPSEPWDLEAAAGPRLRDVTLAWNAPNSSGPSSIVGYNVYRADSRSGPFELVKTTDNDLSTVDAFLANGQVYHYQVAARNAFTEGPRSGIVSVATFSDGSGAMASSTRPGCDPTAPLAVSASCAGDRFGFTEDIVNGPGGSRSFSISWGDFNHHADVVCDGGPCSFWFGFDLQVMSPELLTAFFDGRTVDVAHLERLDGGIWVPVEGGVIRGLIKSPDFPNAWGVYLTSRLLLEFEELGLGEQSTSFKLVPHVRPGGGGDPWVINVESAQAQLVAPPLVVAHGWRLSQTDSLQAYKEPGGWQGPLIHNWVDRAHYTLGQNPWHWTGGDFEVHPVYSGKADFRESAFEVYDKILSARSDPSRLGLPISFDGPVDIVAYSMGGLVTRYLLEDILPRLEGSREANPLSGAIDELFDEQARLAAYDADELVGNVVMMATPHLGSSRAEHYIAQTEFWKRLFCGFGPCEFYRANDGEPLLDPGGPPLTRWEARSWWVDSIGAFRNWDRYDDNPRVDFRADFELMDESNPILDDLIPLFSMGHDIRYFLQAGAAHGGDFIVNQASGTNNHDDRVCWAEYDGKDASYNVFPRTVAHWVFPSQPRVQNDAFAFVAGGHHLVCDNLSPYANQGVSSMSTMAAGSGSLQEPTVAFNGTSNATHAQALFEWAAPASAVGTITLLGDQSALDAASFVITSPSGAEGRPRDDAPSWFEFFDGGSATDGIALINFTSATGGLWRFEFSTPLAESPPLVMVNFESDTRIEVASLANVVVGQPETIEATVFDGGSPALQQQVHAVVWNQGSSSPEQIPLKDDGLAPDGQANDGIYSASHSFSTPGHHDYMVNVTLDGVPLSSRHSAAVQQFDGESVQSCTDLLLSLDVSALRSIQQENPRIVVDCLVADILAGNLPGGEGVLDALTSGNIDPAMPDTAHGPTIRIIPLNSFPTPVATGMSAPNGTFNFRVDAWQANGTALPVSDWRFDVYDGIASGLLGDENIYSVGSYGTPEVIAPVNDGSNGLEIVIPRSAILGDLDALAVGRVSFSIPAVTADYAYPVGDFVESTFYQYAPPEFEAGPLFDLLPGSPLATPLVFGPTAPTSTEKQCVGIVRAIEEHDPSSPPVSGTFCPRLASLLEGAPDAWLVLRSIVEVFPDAAD